MIAVDINGEKKWTGMYSTGDGPGMYGSITGTTDGCVAFAMSGFSCFTGNNCNPNPLAENIVFAKLAFYGDTATSAGSNNGINIYPNPVTDQLTIAFKTTNLSEMEIRIYDPAGRLTLASIISQPDTQYTVDLRSLASGLYFLKVKTSGEQLVRKIIVANGL